MKSSKNKKYDVCIIGGGHAGAEAAWIASQFENLSICLVSSDSVGIASAPCNPAIGGVGKGQVVREIDAMGGLMGRLADFAGIQYRVLNESKGYAVQSTRVQIDKERYSQEAERLLGKLQNLDIIRDLVIKISRNSEDNFEIVTQKCDKLIHSVSLIVTTGTFLAGKLHTGEKISSGGRFSVSPSFGLDDLFSFIKFRPQRFKTGTPPRLKNSSIDFSLMKNQPSDDEALNFHLENDCSTRNLRQVSCYLTDIGFESLEIIRKNKDRSPIFNGQISGVGPRYCPSIEDKAFRYPDRDSHRIFIEPEGLDIDTIYPNGVSTSLPVDVQSEFIRMIPGLENAEIVIPGYAVEYDVVDTTELNHALEHKKIKGLFFAGQVNGTSGYEEAAGQGLVAGLNAALSANSRELLFLNRENSYIGVMIDDLVSTRRDEPYRLFTARNENRLICREDNSFIRMYTYRKYLNLNTKFDRFLGNLVEQYEFLAKFIKNRIYKSNNSNQSYFLKLNYGPINDNISLKDLLKRADLDPVKVLSRELEEAGLFINPLALRAVAIEAKYGGYITRSAELVSKFSKLSQKPLNWTSLAENKNISFECRLRIKEIRPQTFFHLQTIDGIRAATLSYVAGLIS